MKTTRTKSRARIDTLSARSEHPDNRWPTEQEMLAVSKRLARISREGMRREVAGDYFKSGDLAYQLREIIRATDDLLKQLKRNKAPVTPGRPE